MEALTALHWSLWFWGAHHGNEQRWVAGSRKPDGGHLRPCSGGCIGAGWRASFRWVAFACLDLRRRNGNLGLPEACRLEIHSPLASFLLVGTIVGWLVFDFFQEGDDRVRLLKYVVGGILLGMTALHFAIKLRKKQSFVGTGRFRLFAQRVGRLGRFLRLARGLATMLANAAGPVAQLYLLAMGLPKYAFIGTSAWLFLIVNAVKIPFMIELEIITLESISVSWWMFVPAVLGAGLAPFVVKYINQALFERLVWLFIVIAGIRMLF